MIELAASERVRQIREHLGLSVPEFAVALAVTASSIYKWEEGVRVPSEMAMKLMEQLGKEKK